MTAQELETPYWRLAGAKHARELVCDICRVFYGLGWASGTGGSISIRHGSRIYMAPSGVQKERMMPQDIFALDSDCGVLYSPMPRWPGEAFRLSECAPLFSLPYSLRGAGACLHSHSQAAVAVTLMHDAEFRVTHLEMIKGLKGHGYHGTLTIPIINNTARECMLTESMRAAMLRYPDSPAVLVRRHGVYIWGDTWQQAKAQAECLHYLFELAVQMRRLGVDHASQPATSPDCNSAATASTPAAAAAESAPASASAAAGAGPSKRPRAAETPEPGFLGAANPTLAAGSSSTTPSPSSSSSSCAALVPTTSSADAVLLDIEGCTTPLSFVHSILFPFARKCLQQHITDTFGTSETAEDLRALAEQAAADAVAGVPGAAAPFTVPASAEPAAVEACVSAAVAAAEAMMASDRKVGALKALQGHIWRAGYAAGQLSGQVFADVPSFLESLCAAGKRVAIYSSGSREAQRLLFQNAQPLPPGWASQSDTPSLPAADPKRAKAAAMATSGTTTTTLDLCPRIAAYFDTTTGPKTAAASYASIALSLGLPPSRILFATDAPAEAEAAASAGLRVALTRRPGNHALPPTPFAVVDSLAQLLG